MSVVQMTIEFFRVVNVYLCLAFTRVIKEKHILAANIVYLVLASSGVINARLDITISLPVIDVKHVLIYNKIVQVVLMMKAVLYARQYAEMEK